MGTLKTTNIQTITGSGTLTLGTSGETVSFGSGVTGLNYPAFEAYKTSNQTLTDNTLTKVQIETESFDTDNCYDNSTNYRFTVPSGEGGKYLFTYAGGTETLSSSTISQVRIYKNGSALNDAYQAYGTSGTSRNGLNHVSVLDLSAGDYIEIYAYQNQGSAETPDQTRNAFFRGFKIGA